ncbi:MAG: CspA family cold shock protein [Alphaproteobacteria bacterium]
MYFKKLKGKIMTTGTVKWFSSEKGYGFIEPDENENTADIFVHLTAVERAGYEQLEPGQKVSFTLTLDPRKGKPTANDITLLT